jgi:uncharacterized protein YqfB (UPF0267 family)
MDIQKLQKVAPNFHCFQCDYNTIRKSSWEKHLRTLKHQTHKMKQNETIYFQSQKKIRKYKNKTGLSNDSPESNTKIPKKSKMKQNETNLQLFPKICKKCHKKINSRTTEWRHKKICNGELIVTESLEITELFMNMLEQNKILMDELKAIIREPKIINNTTNNIQYNIINYLNSECKHAMNLTDFIDTLHISYDDLLHLKKVGISNSIRETFIKQLCDLEPSMRPIYCSDKKRKKFFVKEDNNWKRDSDNKEIQKGLRYVSLKQIETLQIWKQSNPEWLDDDNDLLNVNAITCEISKIYDNKEKKKIINYLSQFDMDALQLEL